MSELLDKQVNAQKEKNFQGSRKLLQAHEKVCNEMKQRKTRCTHKMLLKEGTPYNAHTKYHELWGNDYGYNEGTICLVNG